MRLLPDWKDVALKAWSVRFLVIAGLLQGIEIALPLFNKIIPIPPMTFAFLSLGFTAAAFIARLLVQQNMRKK